MAKKTIRDSGFPHATQESTRDRQSDATLRARAYNIVLAQLAQADGHIVFVFDGEAIARHLERTEHRRLVELVDLGMVALKPKICGDHYVREMGVRLTAMGWNCYGGGGFRAVHGEVHPQ